MKNLSSLKACFALIFLLFSACQEDIVEDQDPLISERAEASNLSGDAWAEYHYKYMKILAKGLLYQSQNPAFRQLLYQKVGERFDGEPNVLIELLAESYGKEKLYSEVQQDFNRHDVSDQFEDGVRAFDFTDITGEQHFPHIAIPFFEEETTPKPSVRQLAKTSMPVILIENPLKETDAEPGYTLDEKGNFIQMDTMITEEYAKENEVWVLAQNERVNSLEEARALSAPVECQGRDCPPPPRPEPEPPGPCTLCPPPKPPAAPQCNDGVEENQISDDGLAIIAKKMRIVDHKESWYRLGSEIEIVVASTSGLVGAQKIWTRSSKTINDPIVGSISLPILVPQDDYGLGTIKRKDIKDGKQISINRNITYTLWLLNDPRGDVYVASFDWKAVFRNAQFPRVHDFADERADYIIWAVYEKDDVSARSTTVVWVDGISTGQGKLTFVSRDGPYETGHFTANQNSRYFPCKYNTYVLNNNKRNYFFFETARGRKTADFGYDGK